MIGKIFKDDYSAEVAEWCNANNAYIEEIEQQGGHRQFIVKAIPAPTAEEIAERALNQAKADRTEAVSKITVEVDGMVFDGDEEAQQRMSRAVVTARSQADILNANRELEETNQPPVDYLSLTTIWVLADNTIATVTIEQLAKAAYLAGQAQTELWTKPYEN